MQTGINVARYFLNLDKDHSLFTKKLRTENDRKFYEGNARLNKYLHLAQNIYIAKYGEPLMDSVFYAYDNGAVDPNVQEHYAVLYDKRDIPFDISVFSPEVKTYLDKIYKAFRSASLDELIALSHEDAEWQDKYAHFRKKDQRMDSMSHKEEYARQYSDMIKILDRMPA